MKQQWYEWRLLCEDGKPTRTGYAVKKEAELYGRTFSVVRVKVTVQPTKKRK